MKLRHLMLSIVAGCSFAGVAGVPSGRQAYALDAARTTSNLARAKADLTKGHAVWRKSQLSYYVIPALSRHRRLPDAFPEDGVAFGRLEVIAAQGEYEPASFVVFPFRSVDALVLKASALKGLKGHVISAQEVDLKVVKLWYQGGSAWFGYFADATRRKLTPELLLNDETLVMADCSTQDNYVRYDNKDGSRRYAWMSSDFMTVDYTLENQANQALIHDAPTLQPVVLNPGEFKQFMATVHVPADTPAGLYHGTIALTADGVPAGEIPMAVRVLPFSLPSPKTNYDLDKDFYLALYRTDSNNPKLLKNMVRHNAMTPMGFPAVNPFLPETLSKEVALGREAGMPMRPLFSNVAGCHLQVDAEKPTAKEKIALRRLAAEMKGVARLLKSCVGHTDFYSYGHDEAGPAVIRRERAAWHEVHRAGGKVMVSCKDGKRLLYNLDFYIQPMLPTESRARATALIHESHPQALVGWYSNPHTGPENPHYFRWAHGLLPYKRNFDVSANYCWWRNNWNDMAIPYEPFLRGLVSVYGTADNVLDTLAWEGIREGLDDIRYATKLKQLAKRAMDSGNADVAMAGRRALGFVAYTDVDHVDLDAFRMECIRYIIDLQNLLERI